MILRESFDYKYKSSIDNNYAVSIVLFRINNELAVTTFVL